MGKRKTGCDVHGIVLLDKRLGVSSNKALQEVRCLFNANKAGHTGSLDPLATGLLPLCFGEATKVSAFMLDDDKRYQVVVDLGVMTDTGDAEGEVIKTCAVPELTRSQLASHLEAFVGEIQQIPPMYSALKHQGKKLYELARQGQTIERVARHITIHELTLLDFSDQHLVLEVYCSKGTYIRSLAEDIGHHLGSCATVTALRRLAAGRFRVADALTLEQLAGLDRGDLLARLISVDEPLAMFPAVDLSDGQAISIRYGQTINYPFEKHGMVRLYHQGLFLGLGEMLLDAKIAPKKLFNLNDEPC